MKLATSAFLFFWLVGTCSAQGQPALCPRHIETPSYPPIARMANVTGEVVLQATIDADGEVVHIGFANNDKRLRMLETSASENLRHWTFAKPPSAPYKEAISYDYEFDPSLPPYDGSPSRPVITRVSFDLPDRVTIATNGMMVEPSQLKPHR
ncbi:MAG: energy transducer TonB [Candidatus Acidiferrales bacterium]